MDETAVVTNDAETAVERGNAALKALAEKERDGIGALTEFGAKLAELVVDGTFLNDPLVAARQTYEIRRGVLGKLLTGSDRSAISQLTNFPAVGISWGRKGIKLVRAAVAHTEGWPKQYQILQRTLVRLKKRGKGTMPSVKEVYAMLADAKKPQRRERKPKSTETSTETSTEASSDSTAVGLSVSDWVHGFHGVVTGYDPPEYISGSWAAVRAWVEKKAADVNPGLTAGDSSAAEPVEASAADAANDIADIPEHLDRR